jgi:hypothetical protein
MSLRSYMRLVLTIIGVGFIALSHAQTQDSYEYNSEFTWGVNKNSSGGLIGGFVLKKSRKLNERMLETFGLELMNVKHPQEVRKSSRNTGNYFIYGKSNYLYAIRLQYGRDLILFTKAPQQGVEIRAVGAIGPSIGIVAPYYIERAVDQSYFITAKEQYDPKNPQHSFANILGTGNLFQGLGQSTIQMGFNIKAGINFEIGTVKSAVNGFEVGFLLDTYFNKITLMPTTDNYSAFPTVYFTLFYGSRK